MGLPCTTCGHQSQSVAILYCTFIVNVCMYKILLRQKIIHILKESVTVLQLSFTLYFWSEKSSFLLHFFLAFTFCHMYLYKS